LVALSEKEELLTGTFVKTHGRPSPGNTGKVGSTQIFGIMDIKKRLATNITNYTNEKLV